MVWVPQALADYVLLSRPLFQSVLGGQAQLFDSVQSIDSPLIVLFGGSF